MVELSYCCSLSDGRRRDGAGEGQLVGVRFAGANHGERNGDAGLALKHQANDRQGQLARGLVADGFNDVAVGEMLVVGRRAGRDADDGGIAKALGNGDADLGHAGRGRSL